MPNHRAMPVWRRVRARLGDCYRNRIRRDVPILIFHRIQPVDGTGLDTFRGVLDYVASEYRVMTLSELAELLHRKARLPKDAIVLTFDDGTRDQYELAAPELDKRGLRATFAVIGCTLFERSVPPLYRYLHMLEATVRSSVRFGFPELFPEQTLRLDGDGRKSLGKRNSPLCSLILGVEHGLGAEIVAALGEALDVPEPSADKLFISLSEMRSLQDRGHEAAAHSLRHQDVHEPDMPTWERDLRENLAVMNEAFGHRAHPYIYPFGKERRSEVHAKISESGFCCAATSEWGTNTRRTSPYALRRIGIDNDSRVPLAPIY